MQVSVTFRHMEPTEALREYAEEKVTHVTEKYFQSGESSAHVVLSTEKHWHIAHFDIHFKGKDATVEERTEDMYSSIDLAMAKLERLIARYKDKLRDHKLHADELG